MPPPITNDGGIKTDGLENIYNSMLNMLKKLFI